MKMIWKKMLKDVHFALSHDFHISSYDCRTFFIFGASSGASGGRCASSCGVASSAASSAPSGGALEIVRMDNHFADFYGFVLILHGSI
jgi:hypothetical protein